MLEFLVTSFDIVSVLLIVVVCFFACFGFASLIARIFYTPTSQTHIITYEREDRTRAYEFIKNMEARENIHKMQVRDQMRFSHDISDGKPDYKGK